MQTTSATYQTIMAGEHWFETQVSYKRANGNYVTLGEDSILSLERSRPGMSDNIPSIGGALSSTLSMTIITPSYSIPKMGEIVVEYRATNGTDTSEWVAGGTYFVDTRSVTKGDFSTMAITAYDAMMKAEQDYPNTEHDWPYRDTLVVAEIASTIGVTVDARTNQFLTAGHMINVPTDYTMREVLERIAAMNCGNFVITPENELLFVPLYGLDPEANLTGTYLRDEQSDAALTFGNEGWYILV